MILTNMCAPSVEAPKYKKTSSGNLRKIASVTPTGGHSNTVITAKERHWKGKKSTRKQ